MTRKPPAIARRAAGWLLVVALAAGCATAPAPAPAVATAPPALVADASLYATLWLQRAAEYAAAAQQAWAAAYPALEAALADPGWTAALEQEQEGDYAELPPAVILDVDETVLDNTPYQARLIRRGEAYTRASWNAWCEERQAPPVPGALAFTRHAAARGVTVFYVTNRRHELLAATRDNLRRHGFPLVDERETIYPRGGAPGWELADKGPRRRAVTAEFRVLLLIGDNLGDFLSGIEGPPAERAALVARHAERWGRQWIVLPNPVYGSWLDALLGFERGLPPAEQRRRLLTALREGG